MLMSTRYFVWQKLDLYHPRYQGVGKTPQLPGKMLFNFCNAPGLEIRGWSRGFWGALFHHHHSLIVAVAVANAVAYLHSDHISSSGTLASGQEPRGVCIPMCVSGHSTYRKPASMSGSGGDFDFFGIRSVFTISHPTPLGSAEK